jgi:DNA processing protein
MALGVDSLAHWGAIEANGRTVAVLGCGVDVCYPSSNKPLYKSLTEADDQAVVSEFLPGTKPETWRFPARNRIISGMSQALVVVEAGESSGALITAQMAFEQNREVFAIPGRVDSPMSIGTNGLIARNMAHLCRNYMDIMNEMDWVASARGEKLPAVVELYGREREVFELVSPQPVHFDYLLEKTGMNTGELSATLTMLELAGVVARLPGDWYARETQGATV